MTKRVLLVLGVMLATTVVCDAAQRLSVKQRAALEGAVTENLKDPSSAKFRKIELVDSKEANKPGEGIYCGEVNAKNSYGGYTGYMPFIAAVLGDGAFAMNVAHDADSIVVVRTLCGRVKRGEI